ncbi:MAG: NAD(P)/FAD-dependent oxidoreductase [Candidatus Thorarchaeota archaeon]
MTIDTNVIIIGAGPAGLTAARRLEELEISYTLVSRDSAPGIEKACGGYVPGRAIEEFELGEVPGAKPIDAIRMKFPGLDITKVDFSEAVGVNVSRENLGKALLGKVIGESGEVWLDTVCASVTNDSESCKIGYTRKNERGTLSGQILIDASGTNPASLRSAPIRSRPTNNQLGYGVQYQIETETSLASTNDFYYGSEFSPRGYAWSFPRGRETVVGIGGIVDKVRESSRRAFDYLDYLVSVADPISGELKEAGARIVEKEAALMPLAGILRPSFGKRLMLAGDAAGHCSPITGEGIHYSMIGGQKAAEVAARCVKKKDFSDKALSRYENSWTKAFGSDLKWGLWLQKRFLESGSNSMGSTFLNSEKSTRVIAEMLAGARTVRSAILAAAPGYLISKMKKS